MGCLSLSTYTKGCDNGVGGIEKIALFELVDLSVNSMTQSGGTVSALDLATSSVTGYTFEFTKDTSSFTEAMVGDGILANVSYQPLINLVFKKMSNSLRNEIAELGNGVLCAIVKDNNGIYWFIGSGRGLNVIAGAGSSTGVLLTDPNGVTVVLQGMEKVPAYTIDISAGSSVDSTILALFGF